MAGTKLGILLTTSPEHENLHTVRKLSEAALAEGKEVHIFVMCDGGYSCYHGEFTDLAQKGVNIAQCHHNAEERKIEEANFPMVKSASQFIFSNIIEDVDRLITFC